MAAGLGLFAAGTWILRTAVILHNKKIATDEDQRIAVPRWHYAAWIVFIALLADLLLTGGLAVALGQDRLLGALLLAIALRLIMHAAMLSWLLSTSFRAAMTVQVFEVGIALTLAPLVGSILVVMVSR